MLMAEYISKETRASGKYYEHISHFIVVSQKYPHICI